MSRNQNITVIAHRGCNYTGYTENTIKAFQKVIEEGASVIEFDVQKSSDGELLIFHDLYLDKKTDGKGRFSSKKAKYLRAITIKNKRGYPEKIPTLKSLLDLVAKIPPTKRPLMNIELKGNRTGKPVTMLIKKYIISQKLLISNFLISSLIWRELLFIRRNFPKIKISFVNNVLSLKEILYNTILIKKNDKNAKIIPIFFHNLRYLKNLFSAAIRDIQVRIKVYESLKMIVLGRNLYYEMLFSFGKMMKVSGLHFWHKSFSKPFVDKAHKHGFFIWAYTINQLEDIPQLIEKGVDGFFTDFYKDACNFLKNL